MTEWFAADKLVLNLYKTNIMKFIATNLSLPAVCIGYKQKCLEETRIQNFLFYKLVST
jgi:hypothetical protein